MKRILITGGAGFIGSHLSESLLAQNHHVTVIDNLSTGAYQNIEHLEHQPGFRLVVESILNTAVLEELVREADQIFHLASAVGVRLIIDQPVHTIESIVGGTEAVLRLASRYRKPVLITSSSEVYGRASKVPFHEDDDVTLGPSRTRRWAYACAKMLDEFLALAHWHETRLPVVCVRLFNTVGPRQTGQYGMVLPKFVQQALANQPLTVYGDGTQSRCFCHVVDAVDALIRLMNCPQARGRVINVGTTEEVTIHQLAMRVRELVDSQSAVQIVPYSEAYGPGFDDMTRRLPDLTLAGELIGYQPTHNLDSIIRDVLAFWKSQSVA